MDNLNSDMYVRPDPTGRPDPPGSSDFVFQYIDASFDGAGTASTITDYRIRSNQNDYFKTYQIKHLCHHLYFSAV